MTDFKSAAEQQVRETLGWWIECSNTLCFERYQERHGDIATREETHAHQLAVSKTAELLEMTALLQKIADTIGKLPSIAELTAAKGSKGLGEAFSGMQSNYLTLKKFADNQAIARADAERRAESAEQRLAEMTAQRDEAQKALEKVVPEIIEIAKLCGITDGSTPLSGAQILMLGADIQATIREQAERIKELETSLGRAALRLGKL